MAKWDTNKIEDLFKAILALQTVNDAKRFFRDLLTEQEIIEFANRWQVAKMLNSKISYSHIEKKTGMSSTTIARISKWLKKGVGGYKLMLNKLNAHHHTSFNSFEKEVC